MKKACVCCVLALLITTSTPYGAFADHYRTISPADLVEAGIPGLATETVYLVVSATNVIGPLPPLQGDLSQGAETGDPFFYEEMQKELALLEPNLIRLDPGASIEEILSLDDDGNLVMDWSYPDRIVESVRATGAEICWNNTAWPEDWRGENGYPANVEHFAEYTRRFVERYNGDGGRDVHYIEFWNEPASWKRGIYEPMARAAKAADPGVKVGGPAVLDLKLSAIEEMLQAREEGVPVDFVSYHLYYRKPWEYPPDIARVQALLDRYPGASDMEHLITEWGIDMGESGICDTRYNAVYYLSTLEQLIPLWPQVRPLHFELREGWDWKGPSQDLFGRWGMLTYSNLLRKPVYQAARMWALLAGERVRAESTDEDIRVVASRDNDELTVLAWSFPREYGKVEPNDPVHGTPVENVPVRLVIDPLPFNSAGVMMERYVLDHLRSNVNRHPGRNELEKVQEVILARPEGDGSLELDAVLGTHTAHLWIFRPAERAPADVELVADRYQIWAGEAAEVTVRPRHGDDFRTVLLEDSLADDGWRTEFLSTDPLRLRLWPEAPTVPGARYYTAWIQRPDWGALGRGLAEFHTGSPIEVSQPRWRSDARPDIEAATTAFLLRNLTGKPFEAELHWQADEPLVAPRTAPIRLAAGEERVVEGRIRVPEQTVPALYESRFEIRKGEVLLAAQTLAVQQPLVAHRLDRAPALDGDLSEWKRREPLVMGGKENWGGHHLSRYEGEGDVNARVWAGWDDQYLYFALDVEDATHYAPVAGGGMQQWDSVHLGFDLRRDMFDPTLYFEEDDCDYVFAYTDRGVAYRQWGARRPERVPEKVVVGARRVGGHTLYEIALPWEEEFEPYAGPQPGRVMGLSIYVRDFDGNPDEEHAGTLMWGRGLDWHTKRPALFGGLWLE